jgi:hypothetical protein
MSVGGVRGFRPWFGWWAMGGLWCAMILQVAGEVISSCSCIEDTWLRCQFTDFNEAQLWWLQHSTVVASEVIFENNLLLVDAL